MNTGKPYLAHNKGRGAQKYRADAAAITFADKVSPKDIISLDDVDYGKF